MSPSPTREIESIVRKDWGRILAGLAKTTGDVGLAEDSLQEALEAALTHWQKNGLPHSPPGWLYKVAYRKAIDRIRRGNLHQDKINLISTLIDQENETFDPIELDRFPDKRLELIFTCCHPALSEKSKLALTLRTIVGLSTEDIASAFLDDPKTMAQRISRAKSKIKNAGIPYQIPNREDLPSRLQTVLSVIYLIFNAGYSGGTKDPGLRNEMTLEAIRLGRLIKQALPEHPEAAGLLALMLLHDSRRQSRNQSDTGYVPLEFQDRAAWDQHLIEEGDFILKEALSRQSLGPFQLQAAISGVHAHAANWAETDWGQITALYHLLHQMQPTDVIKINYAIALSYRYSIEAGMEMLDSISAGKGRLSYVPYLLAKADLLERNGETEEAIPLLEMAISLTTNPTENAFLANKIRRLSGG